MNPENKDLGIKLLVKTLFAQMGYTTHYEIKLRNKSYINTFANHDISDIDVFGYLFNADLTFMNIGAECKSGEANALEELYKFAGISKYYKLDKAYLVKTKIHQNAREIALQNRFICMTEAELRKLLLGNEIDIDKALKIENAKYLKQAGFFKQYKTKNEKLIDYLRLDFWNRETWKNIHNLVHVLKQPKSQPEMFSEVTSADKYIYYYAAELFSYAILKNSSDAMILNYSDFENAFVNSLYGGAENLYEKRRIQDAVNIATTQTLKLEPPWQSNLLNICSRLSQSPKAASLIPLFIQDVYENCFYGMEVRINQKVVKKYPDLTRKFIQDIMQFLKNTCEIDEKIFADFMAL